MRFGNDHYVPVLKLKRGEKQALATLPAAIAPSVTPLFEVVELKPEDTLDPHLKRSFAKLPEAMAGCAPYFLDVRELEPAGAAGARRAFAKATQAGVPFVPVTGLSRTADVTAAVQAATNGIAIRLTRDEFEAGRVPRDLLSFVSSHGLSPSHTDLLVDLGLLDQMVPIGVQQMIAQFLPRIPVPTQWRTLTLFGFAFPKSMGVAAANSVTPVDRVDWMAWLGACYGRRGVLPRLPTFGDGAIQHPSGVEGFDPRIMNVSATIRYTLDDRWALIKGISTGRALPSIQFPQLARKLVSGAASALFCGAGHCPSCAEVVAAAGGAPNYGSAEKWRRLGTGHHIVNTVNQLRALTWP